MVFSIAFNGKWFGGFVSTMLVLLAVHAVYAPIVVAAVWYVTRKPESEEEPLLAKAEDRAPAPAPTPAANEARLLTGREATRVLVSVLCCCNLLLTLCSP